MSEETRCTNEYQELISGYLDGDLDIADRQRLLAHLASCEQCRTTLEAYRQIGASVRSLPRVVPPNDLRDAIFAETIDSSSRKVYLLSSRLGYSVAALAAVLLLFVVAIYLLINGYQRTIDPEVVASEPGNGVLWPFHRPVEISFNKEMDRESVEAALSIVPASERDRLTRTWDGNTLILGQNQTLHSNSNYTILVTTSAQDKWGKNLGSEFRLQFETSETFALQTPEPLPSPTPSPVPTNAPTSTPVAQPTQTVATVVPPTEISPVAPPAQPTDEPPTSIPAATATAMSQPEPPENNPVEPPAVVDPDPTSTSIEPDTTSPPVDQPDPEPTSTATEPPTATPAPTWTPRPIPSATPTDPPATPTPTEPAPTATQDTIPVVGAFGNVYWGNEVVLTRLGAPVAAANSITGVELDFQHGAMFSRSDTNQTYILETATGVWSRVPSSIESTSSEPGPAPETWVPGGSLGALWSAESWIQTSLGYALAPSGSVFDSRVQTFDNGSMIMSASGQVYVIYGDGAWELYPDPGS